MGWDQIIEFLMDEAMLKPWFVVCSYCLRVSEAQEWQGDRCPHCRQEYYSLMDEEVEDDG